MRFFVELFLVASLHNGVDALEEFFGVSRGDIFDEGEWVDLSAVEYICA